MKAAKIVAVLALSGFIGIVVGCGQKEEQTPPTTSQMEKPSKPALEKAAAGAQKSATDAAAGSSAQAQSLIDKAKGLVEAKKYPEAMDMVKQLSSMKLTADQQKLVDDLKALIQKQMAGSAASEATKSLGGALGGK